jgi:hypothetical protein
VSFNTTIDLYECVNENWVLKSSKTFKENIQTHQPQNSKSGFQFCQNIQRKYSNSRIRFLSFLLILIEIDLETIQDLI